jgi:hypothetical protein
MEFISFRCSIINMFCPFFSKFSLYSLTNPNFKAAESAQGSSTILSALRASL